jgi:DUF1680 family protein
MYSIGDEGLYINMYGGSELRTKLKDGSSLALTQETNYPWDGKIGFTIKEAPQKETELLFRIPGWCKSYLFKINGKIPFAFSPSINYNGYKSVKREWKAGDKIELVLDMPATLLESNPLVEETKNQVAVKRGPVVYCLESVDLPQQNVFNIEIPSNIKLQSMPMKIDNGNVMALTGEAKFLESSSWKNELYREVSKTLKPVKIKLIPYYAWANRGKSDMTVWMPLIR